MARQGKPKTASSSSKLRAEIDPRETDLRIIGGELRGRKFRYSGDPGVRPMKHRTREAIFNLITTECVDLHAVDLFAGSGALGLEAISRGAASATLIEKHIPTARLIEENIRTLGLEARTMLLMTSAFLWAKRDIAALAEGQANERPWLVFCSPPYAFYQDRKDEMLDLIHSVRSHAPAGSILVVEANEPFDFNTLRESDRRPDRWDVRTYSPAVVGVWRAESPSTEA